MAHFLCISLMGFIPYPYGGFNPSPVSYDSSVLPVVNPLILIIFRMTSTNLSSELQSKTILVLKAEGNTCLSEAVITSNLENPKMMHCVIYITVCKNLSPCCGGRSLTRKGLRIIVCCLLSS